MKFLILEIFFVLIYSASSGQTNSKLECSLMKSGTFKYLEAEDPSAFFVITDTSHMEFYGDGKYHIKSQMRWISDCQYSMKMIESTIPDFPFKPGDVMLVTITKIEDQIISYTSEVNGIKWNTKVNKLK